MSGGLRTRHRAPFRRHFTLTSRHPCGLTGWLSCSSVCGLVHHGLRMRRWNSRKTIPTYSPSDHRALKRSRVSWRGWLPVARSMMNSFRSLTVFTTTFPCPLGGIFHQRPSPSSSLPINQLSSIPLVGSERTFFSNSVRGIPWQCQSSGGRLDLVVSLA